MANPLVSVVVPTFNRPELLVETLKSILIQTHRELDIIVVDNHSNYDVGASVASLRDSRIRLFQIHNGGYIGASRNLGIEKGWGSLVAFCDDDDLWEPEKIRAQLNAFDPARHAAVATSSLYVGDVRLCPRRLAFSREEARFEDLLVQGTPAVSSLLLPKEEARFAVTSDFQHVEDFDLLLRLTTGGKTVRILRDPLVFYRVHSANESLDRSKMFNVLNVLKAHRKRMTPRSFRYAEGRFYSIFGILALRAGAPAERYFLGSLRSHFSLLTLGAWFVAKMPSPVRIWLFSLYYSLKNIGAKLSSSKGVPLS